MEIGELARRLAIPARQVRYVFDHGVLPGSEAAGRGRGLPREVTVFEAFGVGCAALQLHAGARRQVVRSCLSVLTELPHGSATTMDCLLGKAFEAKAAKLDIADGAYVRIYWTDRKGKTSNSGWQPLGEGVAAPPSNYEPVVQMTLDLTRLKDRIKI
jgi:hypothetical protein